MGSNMEGDGVGGHGQGASAGLPAIPELGKNTTIYISTKSHLNLTFNLNQCGSNSIPQGMVLSIASSDIFTLLYVVNGSALLEFNDLVFKVSDSTGVFAFPDTHYDFKSTGEEPLEILWLSFSGYMVENYLNRANVFRARPVFSDPEGFVGEELRRIHAAAQKMPNRYCRMMSMLYGIFSYLLDKNPTKQGDHYVDSLDFFAVRAVDYIERNFARNITVEEIAASLGISRKHLYSIFNGALKISPKQYLIYYRIEKACQRLKSSAQSIQEIAESVGYTNQFYFAREFKRLTGMTPSEYRKNPNLSEIFSYRTFIPTLREKFDDHSLDLPVEENIVSVYLPPQTFPGRGK